MTKNSDFETTVKKEWDDPAVREEFLNDFERYRAYRRADYEGLIDYQITERFSLDKLMEIIQGSPYRDSEVVRETASKLQSRKAGKKRRGKVGPLKETLEVIVQHIGKRDWNSVLEALSDEDLMEELHLSTPWEVVSVEVEGEKVTFKNVKGEDYTRSFSRIQSALSELPNL